MRRYIKAGNLQKEWARKRKEFNEKYGLGAELFEEILKKIHNTEKQKD